MFIETIQIKEGLPKRLRYHQNRVDRTMVTHFPERPIHKLDDILNQHDFPDDPIVKARVIYGEHTAQVEYQAYTPRPVNNLKTVFCDDIDYDFKYEDRSKLEELFNSRGQFDDIIIIKNGLVSDTSYANIVLEKDHKWYTPASPLLKGTMRQWLIDKGILIQRDISQKELYEYDFIYLINAMLPLGSIKCHIREIDKIN